MDCVPAAVCGEPVSQTQRKRLAEHSKSSLSEFLSNSVGTVSCCEVKDIVNYWISEN